MNVLSNKKEKRKKKTFPKSQKNNIVNLSCIITDR
jgi:hypothetical protein